MGGRTGGGARGHCPLNNLVEGKGEGWGNNKLLQFPLCPLHNFLLLLPMKVLKKMHKYSRNIVKIGQSAIYGGFEMCPENQ